MGRAARAWQRVGGSGMPSGVCTPARRKPARLAQFDDGLAGALALKGDLGAAKAVLAESLKLKPEVNSLAQWYAYLPWTSESSAPAKSPHRRAAQSPKGDAAANIEEDR
jgi:hypothetical protein